MVEQLGLIQHCCTKAVSLVFRWTLLCPVSPAPTDAYRWSLYDTLWLHIPGPYIPVHRAYWSMDVRLATFRLALSVRILNWLMKRCLGINLTGRRVNGVHNFLFRCVGLRSLTEIVFCGVVYCLCLLAFSDRLSTGEEIAKSGLCMYFSWI